MVNKFERYYLNQRSANFLKGHIVSILGLEANLLSQLLKSVIAQKQPQTIVNGHGCVPAKHHKNI